MRRTAVLIGATAILASGALFLYARILSAHAERLVRISCELSQQHPNPTVADIRRRFGADLKQADDCPPSECAYTVAVSNRVLAILHIVPYAEISSRFTLGATQSWGTWWTTPRLWIIATASSLMCRLIFAATVRCSPFIHGVNRQSWTPTDLWRLEVKRQREASALFCC